MTAGNIMLLSGRQNPFVGWVTVDEFEDLFADLTGARVVTTIARPKLPGVIGRARDRLIGHVEMIKDVGDGELLLIVARSPADLRALYSVKEWRGRFRYVVGYVIDAYHLDGFSCATRSFDHIFTTTQAGAELVRTRYGVSSSVLRTGFDCLNWSSTSEDRSIDLLGFGRQPQSVHCHFQRAFHRHDTSFLYLHSPIGATYGPAVWTERPMMLKLMQKAKLSLAFHLLVEPQGGRPVSMFLTSRWLESLAAGCVVVGRRPEGEMTDAMLNWADATIELPDDMSACTGLLKELAADSALLRRMRHRNVFEMCRQHDWRYRIRDILEHFGLPLPSKLHLDLVALDRKVRWLTPFADDVAAPASDG